MAAMFEKIASLFRKLGTPGGGGPEVKEAAPVAYKGFIIQPAPRREGAHWHIAGSIVSEDNLDGPVHEFIGADTFTAHDEAVTFTIHKARQIIDERGAKLFD
jgi:hypothetical protein